MVGPPAPIKSLRAGGYGVDRQVVDTVPVVEEGGNRLPIEGHLKKDFGTHIGEEATGIR